MNFTTIKSSICVTSNIVLEEAKTTPGYKGDLSMSVYVEEEDESRHITFNIDHDIHEGVDVFLDMDIYQAELLGKKILELVNNRKEFLENKFKE